MRLREVPFIPLFTIVFAVCFGVYLFCIKIPEDKQYCQSKGLEHVFLDRSWACKDPSTGQLYR